MSGKRWSSDRGLTNQKARLDHVRRAKHVLGSWYRSNGDTGPVPVRLSGVRGRACRHARGPHG